MTGGNWKEKHNSQSQANPRRQECRASLLYGLCWRRATASWTYLLSVISPLFSSSSLVVCRVWMKLAVFTIIGYQTQSLYS